MTTIYKAGQTVAATEPLVYETFTVPAGKTGTIDQMYYLSDGSPAYWVQWVNLEPSLVLSKHLLTVKQSTFIAKQGTPVFKLSTYTWEEISELADLLKSYFNSELEGSEVEDAQVLYFHGNFYLRAGRKLYDHELGEVN